MKDLLWSFLKFIIYILSICIIILIINFVINQNIIITNCLINHYKIPKNFNNHNIVQLTDIHSIRSIKQKDKIIDKVKESNPNTIVITGDLIDAEYYKEQNNKYKAKEIDFPEQLTVDFVKELTNIANVYWIYGNHEMMLLDDPENNVFKVALEEMGVVLLNNEVHEISIEDETIRLVGVQDPATLYKDEKYAKVGENNKDKVKQILDDLFYGEENQSKMSEEKFTILLSHRPEYFKLYQEYPIDLVLSGHTHGGIAKIPGAGGLYAHPQGWFPTYSSGVYKSDVLQMMVGAGIGYSKIPIRIFNPPEIVSIKLNSAE